MIIDSKIFTNYMYNFLLIVASIFVILPNISENKSAYQLDIETLKSTRIDTREYTRKLQNRTEKSLILVMKDETEWKISDQYSDYWNRLQDTNNIGKKIYLYSGNNTTRFHNPVQIEIEKEIIYDTKVGMGWKYLLLFMTIGFTCYNWMKYKEII